VHAATPDDVPVSVRFTQIWSNPPIRIGKPELHALLSRWLPRLEPTGVAWLVVGRHLGGDSLAQWLRDEHWSVERHASQRGFRVLRVTGGSGSLRPDQRNGSGSLRPDQRNGSGSLRPDQRNGSGSSRPDQRNGSGSLRPDQGNNSRDVATPDEGDS